MKTLFPALALLCFCLCIPGRATAVQETIDISIPATVVEQVIRDALPLHLETASSKMEGTITIDRLERLELHRDLVSLQGRITGNNLVMHTRVGKQEIRLKLGTLTMPLAGAFRLRFDKERKRLFLRPLLDHQELEKNGGKQAASLAPLLAVLEQKEYAIPLDRLGPYVARFGNQVRTLALQTTDLRFDDSGLTLKLKPIVKKTD